MDHYLNSVLQVIIALDVLGIVAYFVLGGIRSRASKKQLVPQPVTPRPASLWNRLRWRSSCEPAESLEPAFANLRRVLYSYQQGLL